MEVVAVTVPWHVTDGVVAIRPPAPGDARLLVAGRDQESRRWLGPGVEDPAPTAVIVAGREVVGWVDHDPGPAWLGPGEVNVGYALFPAHRSRGHATRGVRLLLHRLALDGHHTSARLSIDPRNTASLAVARRAGFVPAGGPWDGGTLHFVRPVPPLTYSDGVVTIRRLTTGDLDMDLEAKDEEQIRWMWLPGERQVWDAMSDAERRAHAERGLRDRSERFGEGPAWWFAVDTAQDRCVAYVECDLANDHVPRGEANISYSAHPAHRGRGTVARAVRLLLRFLVEQTPARRGNVLVDERNTASLHVAAAVGAAPVERLSPPGRPGTVMVRHVVDLGVLDADRPSRPSGSGTAPERRPRDG